MYERIPFYKQRFDAAGVRPQDCQRLEDLGKFPFTVKNDLRDNYPFGLCAVPMDQVVRVHASSGTTGKPITGPYTRDDLNQWAQCMARESGPRASARAKYSRMPTATASSPAAWASTRGRSPGLRRGPHLFRLDRTPVDADAGLQGHGALLHPDLRLTMAERAEKMGLDIRQWPLRVGCFGAEPWTPAMRDDIEKRMASRLMKSMA